MTLRLEPNTRLVGPDGLLTRDGFNALKELFDQVQDQSAATSYTATQIADADATLNTSLKQTGLTVFDSTNNRLMVASGKASTAAWYVVDGSASVTPT